MSIKILNLRLIVTTGALTLVAASGLMCQKPQTEKSGTAQAATIETTMGQDTMMMSTSMGATTDTNYNKTGTATEYYTCSMHPQVHQAKPGKCPICGMNLEFHKADKSKVK